MFRDATDEQIGFLARELAADVVKFSNEGGQVGAEISDLTGGHEDAPTRGVNIKIYQRPPP